MSNAIEWYLDLHTADIDKGAGRKYDQDKLDELYNVDYKIDQIMEDGSASEGQAIEIIFNMRKAGR